MRQQVVAQVLLAQVSLVALAARVVARLRVGALVAAQLGGGGEGPAAAGGGRAGEGPAARVGAVVRLQLAGLAEGLAAPGERALAAVAVAVVAVLVGGAGVELEVGGGGEGEAAVVLGADDQVSGRQASDVTSLAAVVGRLLVDLLVLQEVVPSNKYSRLRAVDPTQYFKLQSRCCTSINGCVRVVNSN